MCIRWEIVQFNTIRFYIQASSVFIDMIFTSAEQNNQEDMSGQVAWTLGFEKNPTLDMVVAAAGKGLLNSKLDMLYFSSIVKV